MIGLVGLGIEIIKGGIGFLRGRQESAEKGQEARAQLKEKLAGRGSSWLILVMWSVWMAPLVHAYFDPAGAKAAAEALSAMPAYIMDTARWLTIFGAGYPLVPRIRR